MGKSNFRLQNFNTAAPGYTRVHRHANMQTIGNPSASIDTFENCSDGLRCNVWNMNDVKEIVYRRKYAYHIVFDDDKSGEVDFSEYHDKGPIFQPLRDMDFF